MGLICYHILSGQIFPIVFIAIPNTEITVRSDIFDI